MQRNLTQIQNLRYKGYKGYRKHYRKRPRSGDFDYILENNGQTSEKTDIKNDPIEMSVKISDKFVTTRRKSVTSVTIEDNNVTENPYRKSVTPVMTESNNLTENPYRKSVTPLTTDINNITEDPYRKSVTPVTKDSSRDVTGPDWRGVGNIPLKDKEKSILY